MVILLNRLTPLQKRSFHFPPFLRGVRGDLHAALQELFLAIRLIEHNFKLQIGHSLTQQLKMSIRI